MAQTTSTSEYNGSNPDYGFWDLNGMPSTSTILRTPFTAYKPGQLLVAGQVSTSNGYVMVQILASDEFAKKQYCRGWNNMYTLIHKALRDLSADYRLLNEKMVASLLNDAAVIYKKQQLIWLQALISQKLEWAKGYKGKQKIIQIYV